ncbi:hypothetical protein V9R51_002547 [Vibrio cholerae]|uniref:hypothetical protein n=1 Tax=Vibrio cholerae TaxID=666 RepID=UPI000C7EF9F6|nr:hypothetical protein [Vibrio cholerae]EGQ8121610.1 hypothetical protein [Vibrio cholerae]EGQ9108003.1 hypothetical protein [Vibrio cholerae]EGR2435085.1 hypothetical protein [Vibrio cholerae]EGR3921545.1 hypothetical protein [Vibrio cholerae]EHP5030136.1 hypothetical protein [Vibrio cholerae]
MLTLLQGYLLGAALVACGLLWVMVRHLDKHDWQWDKGDIWFHFVFMVLFWPLMLFGWVKQGRPNWADWLKPTANRADYYREIERAYRELKTCGAYVRYKPKPEGICDSSYGEFIFPSALLEKQLIERLRQSPHLQGNDEGKILAWVQSRDESQQEPVDVPPMWLRFSYLADDLIAHNIGLVRCSVCHDEIETGQLQEKSVNLCGRVERKYLCPNGHALLAFELMRFTYSSR